MCRTRTSLPRHTGEGRYPRFSRNSSGKVDPGLRRDDGFFDAAKFHIRGTRRACRCEEPAAHEANSSGVRSTIEIASPRSHDCLGLFVVIPAKAGIHGSAATAAEKWIPAFAGMTAFLMSRISYPGHSPCRCGEPAAHEANSSGVRSTIEIASLRSLDCRGLFVVIPAKAGIHGSAATAAEKWIPACAGMTAFLMSRISYPGHSPCLSLRGARGATQHTRAACAQTIVIASRRSQ